MYMCMYKHVVKAHDTIIVPIKYDHDISFLIFTYYTRIIPIHCATNNPFRLYY